MSASPIADLSYRNYDGPLEPPLYRWWAIAKASIRLSVKKRGFWLWSSVSAYWYLILIIIFYFVDAFATQLLPQGRGGRALAAAQGMGMDPAQATATLFKQVHWSDQFLNAFSISQFLLFIIALLIGVGTIANDNRANALLVYLSKPCTKGDYLIGKWLGIFLPLTAIVAVPTLFFYAYCMMSYRQYGFGSDPWLIVKLLLIIPLPGIFHASVALGISSMFNQGRLAGATYAGLYFFTLFFTKAMQIIFVLANQNGSQAPAIVKTLYYASVDGVQIGLAKTILGTDGSSMFPFGAQNLQALNVPAPSGVVMALIFFGVCAFFLALAWTRVKAVEVVS